MTTERLEWWSVRIQRLLGNDMLKNMSVPMDTHATTEELLEVVFSIWFMLRLYSENLGANEFSHERVVRR
jgi:NTP pyrophosphatase (non-canonical NTP hydrolase)